MVGRKACVLVALAASAAGTARGATFLPENHLYLEDEFESKGGLTKAEFNAVIDRAERIFKPIVQGLGGTYTVNRKWTDSTVNADAEQLGASWQVNMYGGLARRAEITVDGFAMVLCHETGHHLGGFPFTSDWAADEGQADTFATGNCAKLIFTGDPENAKSRTTIDAVPKSRCDAAYEAQADRDLCYRVMNASKSLADLLAALGGTKADYTTPDTTEVDTTNDDHPAAQCRLDTYMAAATCPKSWDSKTIAGKDSGTGVNDVAAQTESGKFYCEDSTATPGALRPRCWFKPL